MNREEKLRQTFKNNSDCYADTWYNENNSMMEGDVIEAMTEDKFVEVVMGLFLIESLKDARKIDTSHYDEI